MHVVKRPGKIARARGGARRRAHPGTCGIAHTRWATHGAPTEPNAHPHMSSARGTSRWCTTASSRTPTRSGRASREEGYTFTSETDTETVVHLIDHLWEDGHGRSRRRWPRRCADVEGTYGIAVVSTRDPEKIVVARHGSPLLIGVGTNGEMLAGSDAAAVVAHTRDVVYLNDGDYAVLTPAGYRTLPPGPRRGAPLGAPGHVGRRAPSRRAATSTSC